MNLLNLIWLVPVTIWLTAVGALTLYTFGWLVRSYYGALLVWAAIVFAGILLFR